MKLLRLTIPSYRAKYVKNVLKGSLGWVFMVLIHRLNAYERLKFWGTYKKSISIQYIPR